MDASSRVLRTFRKSRRPSLDRNVCVCACVIKHDAIDMCSAYGLSSSHQPIDLISYYFIDKKKKKNAARNDAKRFGSERKITEIRQYRSVNGN